MVQACHLSDLRGGGRRIETFKTELGMVVHDFNPSIQEAEAGRSLVHGQPSLQSTF